MPHPEYALPIFAMLVLLAVTTGLMLRERIREITTRRISQRQIASSTQMQNILQDTRAADNYKNQCEMPIFFHALCVLLACGVLPGSGLLWAGVWLYVALRVAHSIIHIGYNHVMHRFRVFSLSMLVLLGLWVLALWPTLHG